MSIDQQQKASILISDFDGTMTQRDFYELLCQKFPHILQLGAWEQYENNEITHFEALQRMFSSLKTDESTLLDLMDKMRIEPRLKELIDKLAQAGWEVAVASAGCAWYITKLLSQKDVDIPVHSNPGHFIPGKGLEMTLPLHSPFFCKEIGIDKAAVVKHAQQNYSQVAFAGDGKPDLAAALLVEPDKRFAKSWLANKLHTMNQEFRPFEQWSEVAETLLKEGPAS
ncbi:MAG: MtnX-like HAD-IB family phosphatase [Candidatus Electrothrix aestuarii]|uniref:MtnX-like HAD-IB family phosphatase n=1 Tax=Candidatus Electrothrix aestuarii TaxID=3062594 RepID=A0AAU8M0A7_9BACT|nr:MtnX-like HAD-IB family phosphatase [Candidatus Electrothrix aestuarii]